MNKPKSFQDAFWGADFCSSAGFETLKRRMKDGRATCKSYFEYLRMRSKAEEEYAKALLKSAKSSQEFYEIGSTMQAAFDSLRSESEVIANSHLELSEQLQCAAKRMNDFMNRQKAENKVREEIVAQTLRTKVTLFRNVQDAKRQYEQKSQEAEAAEDAFNRAKQNQNTYTTKDYDKIVVTARKTKQDADRTKRNYEDSVNRLELARGEWEQNMMEFCKLCEQQEDARIRMLQNEMWVGCNLTSICSVDVDERCEAVRQKLEQVNVNGDIQGFISACGTGRERPARVYFEEYQSRNPASSSLSAVSSAAVANQPPLNYRRPSDPCIPSGLPHSHPDMAMHGAVAPRFQVLPPQPTMPMGYGRSAVVDVPPSYAMTNGRAVLPPYPQATAERRQGQPVQIVNKHYQNRP